MPAYYVPVLRAKAGELEALGRLSPRSKAITQPLLEIQRHDGEGEDVTLQTCAEIIDKLCQGWGTGKPIYFDLPRFPPNEAVSLYVRMFAIARQRNIVGIPVTGPLVDRGPESSYLEAVAKIINRDGRGAAVRMSYDSIIEADTLATTVEDLISSLRLASSQTDVILDAESIATLTAPANSIDDLVQMFVRAMTAINEYHFRSVTIAGSSIPPTIKRTIGTSPVRVPRTEFSVWKRLSALDSIPTLRFGDYGVTHTRESDPTGPVRAPSKIRFTTENEHLLFKGRPEQYDELTRDLVKCAEWGQETPSWGHKEIRNLTIGSGGSGNATTWVARDTNTHIETTSQLVERELLTLGKISQTAVDREPWLQEFLQFVTRSQ